MILFKEDAAMKEKKKSLDQLDQVCAGCAGQGIACKGCVCTSKMFQRPYSATQMRKVAEYQANHHS